MNEPKRKTFARLGDNDESPAETNGNSDLLADNNEVATATSIGQESHLMSAESPHNKTTGKTPKHSLFQKTKHIPLEEAVTLTQEYMTQNHATVTVDLKKGEVFLSFIDKFLSDQRIEVKGFSKKSLIDRLYAEMREHSILTPYLSMDTVEEINVNAWDDIKITYSDGTIKKSDEQFFSPTHASDVIARILQKSQMTFDETKPTIVGHLGTNKRVTAMGFGVIDRDKGVAMSIRIVNPKELTKREFIEYGTATEDMMDFLLYAYRYNISMCIAGATSSGKTTLMSLLLKEVPHDKRLVTIEGGCREFDCVRRDKDGNVINNVIHLVTKESEKEKQTVNQNKLLEVALTINPDFIAVAEMKGDESFQAVSAANTGHSVITTIHANSCGDTYARMVVLCKQRYQMDDNTLMGLTTSAFPVVAYCKKLADNSRHIMEITECEGIKDGIPIMRTLYRYKIKNNSIGLNGQPVVSGSYEKVSNPSEGLLKRMKENGMPGVYFDKLFAATNY